MIGILLLASLLGGPQTNEEYVQREEKRVQKDMKVLETNPTDPEASLAVGKFLCFVRADWDRGLQNLAVCKDQTLVSLAMIDLGTQKPDNSKNSPLTGATFEYGEEIALEIVKGDQWWTEAKNHQGSVEKINIYNRAAFWYRKATKTVDDSHRKKLFARINAHSRAMGAVEIRIPASALWTDSQIEVVQGQMIRLTCKGTWTYDLSKEKVGWMGYPNAVPGQPMPKDIHFLCLTAKVGEGGKQYACYKDNPHVAETDGHLFFGPNHWTPEGTGDLIVCVELTLPY